MNESIAPCPGDVHVSVTNGSCVYLNHQEAGYFIILYTRHQSLYKFMQVITMDTGLAYAGTGWFG